MASEPHNTFLVHPESNILTQETEGLNDVLLAVRQGESIIGYANDLTRKCVGADARQYLLCQTSGSTGEPKTIRRQPLSWIKSFEVNQDRFDLGPADVYAVLGALSHSLSLYGALEAFHLGADIAGLNAMRPKQQIRSLAAHNATVLYATPSQLRALIKSGNGLLQTDSKLRWIFSGGGKLDELTKSALENMFAPVQVIEFYGASETSFITITDEKTPIGSVGRPYPGVNLRISQPSGSHENAVGEIWVSSPYLFDGYEEEGIDEVEWDGHYLSIGETGYQDGEGNLFLSGKLNRMFTVAEQNVFPEAIEQLIQGHHTVRHCAVLPQPDIARGQVAICFVEPWSADFSADQLKELCRQTLGNASTPRQVFILENFPLTASGKPDLIALQKYLDNRL